MKRIEFIAPVDAMRGNLGETQRNIVYPTHDNRAYDGPVGERNTARNYNPIIVGAKRANGKTYFSVRTKTTNHLTLLAKKSMAAMGATCSIFAAMRKDLAIAAKMEEVFTFMLPYLPAGATPRSYFMERISIALKDKDAVIDLSAGQISFTVNNPFIYGGSGIYNVVLNVSIIEKFFDQLNTDPISFSVYDGDGSESDQFIGIGFSQAGMPWRDYCDSAWNKFDFFVVSYGGGYNVIGRNDASGDLQYYNDDTGFYDEVDADSNMIPGKYTLLGGG